MKRLKQLSVMIMTALVATMSLTACSGSDVDGDEYYVKYEVTVTAPDGANNLVGMNTPNGVEYSTIVGTNTSWQATYGPVSKGFEASVACSDFRNSTNHTLRISVSKNNGPFVVKADGNGNYLDLKYVISD